MNTVISAEQARKITGGRTPLVPIEYEHALKALQACITIDETKYWSDKADALAAWAKIYHNDRATIEARRLKLHAYRRMGELAHELRPKSFQPDGKGMNPGPVALLVESGLQRSQASQASRISKIPAQRFKAEVNRLHPPTPFNLAKSISWRGSKVWLSVSQDACGPGQFRGFCRRHNPTDLARQLTISENRKAAEIAKEIFEWADEFDQALESFKTSAPLDPPSSD